MAANTTLGSVVALACGMKVAVVSGMLGWGVYVSVNFGAAGPLGSVVCISVAVLTGWLADRVVSLCVGKLIVPVAAAQAVVKTSRTQAVNKAHLDDLLNIHTYALPLAAVIVT